MLVELTQVQKLHIRFCWRVEGEDLETLAFLHLIDETTDEQTAKELKYILESDDVVGSRRWNQYTTEQNAARAKNPDPEWNDPEAWFHYDVSQYSVLDIVKEMSADERKQLRARLLAVRR